MSKVATAQAPTSQLAPTPLKHFWLLSIMDSSLTGKLTALDVMAQLPVPATENVNRVLGGVWSASNKDLYSILAGRTDVLPKDGRVEQTVSFEVIYEGNRYTFSGGVLSLDGTQITGGRVDINSLGIDPSTFAEDGTWSAQASPGGPGDPKPRGRTKRQRR